MTSDVTGGDGLELAAQRQAVRQRYGGIAEAATDCCSNGDCDAASGPSDRGSTHQDLAAVDAADLQLGCDNPATLAALELGETVLDLGLAGGFDCFLAAGEVGPDGSVIGVDMTGDGRVRPGERPRGRPRLRRGPHRWRGPGRRPPAMLADAGFATVVIHPEAHGATVVDE
jgi:hypothetical protein